ncbi:hypothetical protein K144313037_24740 [Clostridium tetani]|uniref:ABC transporter permease n=1 Tax=Clostridium tetani TaxID=1513 RepID=UPI0005138F63|nr:ABC transporter permease [Clostridium tetani]KGI43492.1 hypothetical protein KY55_06680 [Clostridium tetani]RXI74235.1 ABC transporter permease [Clostridium tetani]RXM72775.1 ABC transporter permease [Clostridium tetani]BDR71062.1 hypothetical protein K144313037_24740 [Clostridium tetani]BDR76878.1 hypothetical protein K154306013_25380 [Clostridium tetani]
MLNYIKAELYRNFNRIYFWGYTFSIAAFAVLINILLKISNVSETAISLVELIKISTHMLILPIFLIAAIVEMVTAEENKNLTSKNIISFGLSRNKFVLSKIIVSIILSIIAAVIILTLFFGSGTLLFGIGKGFSTSIVINFIKRLLVSTLLWIGSITICTFLASIIKNNTTFAFAYAALLVIFSKVIKLLSVFVSNKFQYIYDILISTQINKLTAPELTSSTLICAALIGIVYTIVFTVLTMICVKNKEIK